MDAQDVTFEKPVAGGAKKLTGVRKGLEEKLEEFDEYKEDLDLQMQLRQRIDASDHIDLEFRKVFDAEIVPKLTIEIRDSVKLINENMVGPSLKIVASQL